MNKKLHQYQHFSQVRRALDDKIKEHGAFQTKHNKKHQVNCFTGRDSRKDLIKVKTI